jgi:hypothetical protein
LHVAAARAIRPDRRHASSPSLVVSGNHTPPYGPCD